MMGQRSYSLIRYTLLLSVAVFLLWLLNLNFPRNRVLPINLDFFYDQKITSKIGPGDRIKNQDDLASIIDSPVYFDLRFLPWFDQARLVLVYKSEGRILQGLGYQTGPGFSFSVLKPISEKIIVDNFYEAVFIVDLHKVYQKRNITRFLIETKPENQTQAGDLKIKSLQINLIR